MAEGTLPISNGSFLFSTTIAASGDKTALLNTENKFIDKNISIKIYTPAGHATANTVTAAITVNNSTTGNGVNIYGVLSTTSSRPASGYYVALDATASGSSQIDTAGWFDTGELPAATIDANSPATKFFKVIGASGKVTHNAAVSTTVTYNNAQITTTSTNTGIKITASGSSTASGSITASISTAGYIPTGTMATASISKNATTSNTIYIAGVTFSTTFTATAKSNTQGIIKVTAYSSNTATSADAAQQIVTNGVWSTTTVTPGTANIGPLYGKVTISGDADLDASKIKSGVNIFGVAGTFSHTSTLTDSKTGAGAGQILTGYAAFLDGAQVNGTMANRGALNQTITTQGGKVTLSAGYYSGGTITASLPTTSVNQRAWSKNGTSKVISTTYANWGAGYITTAGNIPAVTFTNTASNTANFIDLSDALVEANGAYYLPEATNDGWIYISRGYIDNVRINIGRFIPDFEDASHAANADFILQGYHAYDQAGNAITGSIGNVTLPSAAVSTTAGTLAGTIYVKTSDQYIVIPPGYISSTAYYTFNKTTSSNYTAANIKYNTTISVNNGSSNVYSVKGTYSQVTGGKTAVAPEALRSGYAGFANGGSQVNGIMPDTSASTTFTAEHITTYFSSASTTGSISIVPKYTVQTAGYITATANKAGTTLYYNIITTSLSSKSSDVGLTSDTTGANGTAPFSIYSSSTTRNIKISTTNTQAEMGANRVYIKITGTGSVACSTTGWVTTTAATSIANAVRYISMDLYTGAYST